MCWSLFNKVVDLQASSFIKKRLQHSYFPVNIAKILRTPILKNIYERLAMLAMSIIFQNVKYSFSSTSIKHSANWWYFKKCTCLHAFTQRTFLLDGKLILLIEHPTWKMPKFGVFSDFYFPIFALKTEIFASNICIDSEYGRNKVYEKLHMWTLQSVPGNTRYH